MGRVRALAVVMVSCGMVGSGHAVAQEPPPPQPQQTHGAPDGTARNSNPWADVSGRTKVKILLVCQEGSVPCRGAVTLKTRSAVRTRSNGPRRVVTVLSGQYGEIAPGEYKRVTYDLRRAARHHILRHALTPTRITIFVEGSSTPVHFTIPDRVTVRNSKAEARR